MAPSLAEEVVTGDWVNSFEDDFVIWIQSQAAKRDKSAFDICLLIAECLWKVVENLRKRT